MSVVAPHGDILLTAAHCVSDNGAGIVFVSAYHNGVSPYGRWTIIVVNLTPGWMKSQALRDDFAFLTVTPRTIDGQRTEVEPMTGAYQLV